MGKKYNMALYLFNLFTSDKEIEEQWVYLSEELKSDVTSMAKEYLEDKNIQRVEVEKHVINVAKKDVASLRIDIKYNGWSDYFDFTYPLTKSDYKIKVSRDKKIEKEGNYV